MLVARIGINHELELSKRHPLDAKIEVEGIFVQHQPFLVALGKDLEVGLVRQVVTQHRLGQGALAHLSYLLADTL